jgi:hypothetical protein
MATGIEAAGLVLGAIPLILAGLEFYAKGIAVTKRYWKYKEEIETISQQLRSQGIIYLNTINILLIGVVESKEMAEFLATPGGPRWQEKKFDQKLQARLGTSYSTYMETINQLGTIAERLRLNSAGQAQFVEPSTIKQHYKRWKFCLKFSEYKDLIEQLEKANQTLKCLTEQTASLGSQQALPKSGCPSVSNFLVVKDRAEGLYEALRGGWSCSCRGHHSVSLRLEARMNQRMSEDDYNDNKVMQVPFHVLFHYNHQQASMTTSKMREAPWIREEADVHVEYDQDQAGLTMARKTQQGKGVRFAGQNIPKAGTTVLECLPNMQPIKDLCSTIRLLQKPAQAVWFSLPAKEIAKRRYSVHIYPNKQLLSGPDTWAISSVRSLLDDKSFTRKYRQKVAVTLASSVLQLHETPWLRSYWGTDNIFFLQSQGQTIYDQPFVSRHFNQTCPTSTTCIPHSVSRIIRNHSLYALGIALIELWYGKTLSVLHEDTDGRKSTGMPETDFMTELQTAHRLALDIYNEAGDKYGDAVTRCIRCNFESRSSSLENVQFQKEVYRGVVAQVKESYEMMFTDLL